MKLTEKAVSTWSAFEQHVTDLGTSWVFRGDAYDRALSSTLERACRAFGVKGSSVFRAETRLIHDFRRRYRGRRVADVMHDTLCCLSVMQHHGAPTRLLDFTYSPFVALFFALEDARLKEDGSEPEEPRIVWCVNQQWCHDAVARLVGAEIVDRRNEALRGDDSFEALYFADPPHPLVFPENPYRLTPRLVIQQGVFLCPGDVSIPFEENLAALRGTGDTDAMMKLQLHFSSEERERAIHQLIRMNVDSAALFPGVDGFARSLEKRIVLYKHTYL